MDLHAWIAVGTLVVAVTLFITKWIPHGLTALTIPVVLTATGVLEPKEGLSGFANPAVLALAGIFVLGAGLQEAGVATMVGRALERMGGRRPTTAVLVIMITTAVLSAFMSNAAAVAVFLPAVAVLARRTGIAPSQLMMPLAFSAILGGTLTLIGTTPNLILAHELKVRTGTGLSMFEFAKIGAPITAACIAFMAFVGWRMLPKRTAAPRGGSGLTPEELARTYEFTENLYRLVAKPDSAILGRSIAEVEIGRRYHLDVVFVIRGGRLGGRAIHPSPDLVLTAGDEIFVEGEEDLAQRFAEKEELTCEKAGTAGLERVLGRGVVLAEITLAPRSDAIGKTLRDLAFRRELGLTVISISRRNDVITTGTANLPLEIGDALLVSGTAAHVRRLARSNDFVVLGDGDMHSEDIGRAPIAVLILILALLPPLLGWLPLSISALAGALLMFATGCFSAEGADRSVDWTVLFLLVGTIPLGLALERSGVAASLADALQVLPEHLGSRGLLGGLFVVSAILSTTSNNGAAAVILAPVAARAAVGHCDTASAFLAVAYGASCAFVLPFAHQCNLMVMGPAGYSTKDFVKIGSIMSVVMALTAILLLR